MRVRKPIPRALSILFIAGFLLSPLICLLRPGPAAGRDLARLVSWLVCTGCFVAMLAVSGRILRDFLSGLLIDSRNRYSLSRLQMTTWTVLAIPALLVALGNNALRAQSVIGATPLAIDWTLVALMGISLTSFITTPLLLSVRAKVQPDEASAHRGRSLLAEKQGLPHGRVCSEGSLLTKSNPADARLSDLLTGEEVGNAATLDLSRIQMLSMTLIVWVVYAVMVGRVLGAGGVRGYVVPAFPTFDKTLLALLAISHAGYITGKITPKTPTAADDPLKSSDSARALARTTLVATGVESLSTQIAVTMASGATLISGDRQLACLRDQTDAIRAAVGDVQRGLADGGPADGALDSLEGRLGTVTALYRALVAQGGRPQLADEPSPNLVAQIKRDIGSVEGQGFTAGDAWLPADQALLERFVTGFGLRWDDLARPRYRAFEDVLDLIRTMPVGGHQ